MLFSQLSLLFTASSSFMNWCLTCSFHTVSKYSSCFSYSVLLSSHIENLVFSVVWHVLLELHSLVGKSLSSSHNTLNWLLGNATTSLMLSFVSQVWRNCWEYHKPLTLTISTRLLQESLRWVDNVFHSGYMSSMISGLYYIYIYNVRTKWLHVTTEGLNIS